MNIAHIIPHSITYPLKIHNGRYDWVLQLAQLQVKMGHTVTIYCNRNSIIDGIHTAGTDTVSNDKKQDNIATFALAFKQDHDIYHSHFDSLHFEVSHLTTKPIVFTQHWWPYEETILAAHQSSSTHVWAVPPTQYMYNFDVAHQIQSKGYIYHGIDLTLFRPTAIEKNNRLLFVGRISPEKRIEDALYAAEQSGIGLDIVGKITPKNQEYWQSLLPRIDGTLIKYHGTKSQTELIAFYTAAIGVLCTFENTEAFGLVAIEAQACGTPVILPKGGSRSELVKDAHSGFLYSSSKELIDVVQRLHVIRKQDCIAFARTFDMHKMSDQYAALYSELIR